VNAHSPSRGEGEDATLLSMASGKIARVPGEAIWETVRVDLLNRIRRGEFNAGELLPSENKLAGTYGINRLTVRRALNELARSGVVRTEPGVGTYVATAVLRHRIDDGEMSLRESLAPSGVDVTQHLLGRVEYRTRDENGAIPELSASAGIGLSEPSELWSFPAFPGPLTEFRYVRYVDRSPWCTSFTIVPSALVPSQWEEKRSIFDVMAERNDLRIRRDERRFSAIAAEPSDAALLEVPVGTALLLLSGTNVDDHGRTVAYIVHRIRGDRAEYALRLPQRS
jgi:DNA-binding GntR family transcriptional regulator